MNLERYNRPIFFYLMSLIIPWCLWLFVAYLSHLENRDVWLQAIQAGLGMMGLISPVLVAGYLFSRDRSLIEDLKVRFLSFAGFPVRYTFITLLLIPVSIIAAQLLSVLIGHGLEQFVISGRPTFTSMLLPPWFILLFAPVVEEIAWHSYGTDTLRRRFNLFTTSMIFAAYWVVWHIPLAFIKGYYQSNVIAEGPIHSLNFAFSLFVFVILMNWLYYKTNRSIVVAVLFHLTANISNEIFATHPDSKVIQTAILLLVSGYVLIAEREMFFSKTLPTNA
ncbi:MAG: CPBP family intramembrane metalloprotease [Leptospirales bacterium]|nr:CPBP family intramembrane metalloprotease [Leptospirales bacterium]